MNSFLIAKFSVFLEIVSEKFKEQEIFSMDNKKSFKPHVTILKFSKLPKRGKAINSNKIGNSNVYRNDIVCKLFFYEAF